MSTHPDVAAQNRHRLSALLAVLALCLAATLTTAPTAHASDVGGRITRDEVLSRAKSWVDQKVPYSLTSYYPDPQGRTYRQDCSGMVSMAWHLGESKSTRTLPEVSTRLGSFADLQPGDMLLKASTHARLFVGWTDSSKKTAWVYEESPGIGAHASTYSVSVMSGQGYLPWRYVNIQDGSGSGTAPTTYNRIAVARADGSLTVKQGAVNATWSTLSDLAAQTAVEGDRVAMLTTGGDLYVKSGATLGGAWALVYRGVVSFDLSGDRIGVVDTAGRAYVKDGGIGADWIHVMTPAARIVLDAERVGVLDPSGTLWVKDGALTATWTKVATAVTAADLGADRIAVVLTSGAVQIKEGSLNAQWTTLTTGGRDVVLAGNRIGVLTTTGAVLVKEGPVTATWTTVAGGKAELDLHNQRIAIRDAAGQVWVKDGPLNAAWVSVVASGAVSVGIG